MTPTTFFLPLLPYALSFVFSNLAVLSAVAYFADDKKDAWFAFPRRSTADSLSTSPHLP